MLSFSKNLLIRSFALIKLIKEFPMRMTYLINILIAVISLLTLTFCSAQPTIRYEEKKNKSESSVETETKSEALKFNENFDITPFRIEINLPDKKTELKNKSNVLWYQYELKDDASLKKKKIVGTMNGFRVQVIATDDLDEANKIQEELKTIKGSNEVYSVFEPPFYKILVGDFKTSDEANSLRFKLNQLGYSESKTIKSTINLFE